MKQTNWGIMMGGKKSKKRQAKCKQFVGQDVQSLIGHLLANEDCGYCLGCVHDNFVSEITRFCFSFLNS